MTELEYSWTPEDCETHEKVKEFSEPLDEEFAGHATPSRIWAEEITLTEEEAECIDRMLDKTGTEGS